MPPLDSRDETLACVRKAQKDTKDPEAIAKIIGKSTQTVYRCLQILQTPAEVQAAFEAKQLSVLDACRVAGATDSQQQNIAARLRASGSAAAKKIVAELLPRAATRRGAGSVWYALRHAMTVAVAELPSHTDNIRFLDQSDRLLIEKTEKLFAELKSRCPLMLVRQVSD